MSVYSKRTGNRKIAAAIAPLGFPVKVEVLEQDKTGAVDVSYHIHLNADAGANLAISKIIEGLTDGTLEANDPRHSVLDGMRGILNCMMLRDWREKGNPYHLIEKDQRFVYVPGSKEIPNISKEFVKTGDDFMAAALGVAGIPIVNFLDGKWVLPQSGLDKTLSPASDLIDAFRGKSIIEQRANDTVSWAYEAARIYDAITERVRVDTRLIAITRPGSKSVGAVVRNDISNKGMDKVGRFFGV